MTGSWNARPSLRAIGLLIIASAGGAANAADGQTDVPPCAKLSEVQMVQLLNGWRAAFVSGSAEQLSSLYADDATLVATKDGKVYKGRDAIRTYYKDFFSHHPRLSIRPASLVAGCASATISGPVVYRVTGERKGTRTLLGGRYEAEFKQVGGKWEIIRHSLAADPRNIGEPFDKAMSAPGSDL
ncbi:MAG: nuclear transport factor 2 family protein [Proteobacteria bacterium]|nr:nuclear transport factor 2 family protein [Pseudomonadota bacterium]